MMRAGDWMKPIFMAEIIPQVVMVKKMAEVSGWEIKIELRRHILKGKNGYIRLM